MALNIIYKPKYSFILKRFGKKNDGGYLISKESVRLSNYLISIGINEDWSFEKDIKSKFPHIKIFCYDDKLETKFLIKEFLSQLFFVIYNLNFKLLFKKFYNLIDFIIQKKTIHFTKKKIQLNDLYKLTSRKKNIFLKIDIDGNEYRIFNNILKIKKKLTALVIELHDIDFHEKKIENFLKKINMSITHIHPNNYGPLDLKKNPTVIEITLEKNPIIKSKKIRLPHFLDQKCDPHSKDKFLSFKNK